MFSQWAAKRVCKFFLKRLLGKVIRGEVDLDRLDVQLGSGIIQLSDLALNSDYLNEQLGATPVIVKEGSIGSISIQIPWKALSVEKCEIELEELEIVLTPRLEAKTPRRNEDCSNSEVERLSKASSYWQRSEQDGGCGAQNGGSTYLGVHDGVKMIAKMVERLLLGLRVRIKNLIIAFDEGALTCESHLGSRSSCQPQSIPVLRVPQMEYGTEISEDDHECPVIDSNNSTELSILTKIIRFQGATLDLYDVEEEEEGQSETLRSFVSSLSGKAAGRQPSCSPIAVIDGNDGGFTGLVQLSIPWKSGCVEIPKVDIEISIHPLKLRLEPCTVQRMILLLHSLCEYGEVSSESGTSSKDAQSMGQKFGSLRDPSGSYCEPDGSVIDGVMFSSCAESLPNFPQQIMEEMTNSTMLPVTMFIPDWVHGGVSGAQLKGGAEDDTDLGASVDEFFECFDATRSSHASLANSGLWNWTCSVFTAVTAASTLASGSIHMPSGQQRLECNLKGRLSSVSVMITFEGQHWSHRSELQKNHGDGKGVEGTGFDNCLNGCRHAQQLGGPSVSPANSHIGVACSVENSSVGHCHQKFGCCDDEENHLEASFQDLDFSFQVSAYQVKFRTTVKRFEVYEHVLDARENDTSLSLSNCEQKYGSNISSISCLQAAVEDALPPFPLSLRIPGMVSEMRIEDVVLSQEAVSSKSWNKKECSASTLKKMVKIKLLTCMSDSTHHFSLSRHLSSVKRGGLTTSCTKIDAQLQPFVLWVDVYMVNKLWGLIKGIENTYEKFSKTSDDKFAGERWTTSHDSSFQKVSDETREACFSEGGMDVQQGIVQGNIHLSCGRIILSFPIGTNRVMSPYLLSDNFLCINLSEPANLQNGQLGRVLKHDETSLKDYSFPSSSFINLNVGESGLFLVSPPKRNNTKRNSSEPNEPFLVARKIFSITKEEEWDYSTVSIQWRLVAGAGPWIATRAWERATAHQARGNGSRREGGNSSEFAAATAAGGLEDIDSHVRQDMILSSSVFIHFSLPRAQLDLYGSEHIKIGNLLSLLTDSISCENMGNCLSAVGEPSVEKISSSGKGHNLRVSQSSILLECRVVDISIHLEELVDAKAWMDKELPGSWESFRLTVQNFEILSVSNLGSIAGDSYLWITHNEGELRGSLSHIEESSLETVKDLFLLCCKNDAQGRGDGGGSNALAAGNAGTAITYLSCSERLRSLTTVSIRCGTFVAPGGRLDWLVAIFSFFNQSTKDEHQFADTCPQGGLSTNDNVYCTSFLLDLLDVAVSYEPFLEATTGSSTIPRVESYSHSLGNLNEESYAPVACILAVASVSLSNDTISNTVSEEYMIWLQDVGLLLLDLATGRSDKYSYGTESLRRNGYVRIAREALMGLVVKTNCEDGLRWKVECSDNHICFDTCHDTMAALSRLVAQFQQIFAPDIEESVMHLQTRHGDGKQASTAEMCSDIVDDTVIIEKCGYVSDASKENLDGNHTCGSTLAGLMDGILENAFSLGGELKGRVENDKASDSSCEGQINIFQCDTSLDGGTLESATYGSAFNVSPSGKEKLLCESTSGIPAEDVHVPSLQKACFKYIEDYYLSESYSGSHISESKHSKVEESVRAHKTSIATAEDIVDGRGGWYKDSSLRVWENHISKVNCHVSDKSQCKGDEPCSRSRIFNLSGKNSQTTGRVLLRNFNIKWSMCGGSDWPNLRKYDCLLVQGECGRNASSRLEVKLQGVDFQYDSFPEGGIHASKLAVSIHDLRIYDCSKDAPWKMVLGYYHSKLHPRESSAKALKLELEAVKPDPSTPLEEYRLLVELLPLRLHLDQGQLDFLIKFFSPKATSPALQMQPADDRACCRAVAAHATDSRGQSAAEEALLPFFQKCEIGPVIIRVDYVPRRIDLAALRGGNYAELLNLFSWKGIDLHLKHVHAVGVHGWSSVSGVVIGEWLEDISRNQVHKLIKGLAPVRSLFAVGSGAAKLVVLPAEHYKRDRRLLRGMRKGAIAFLRSISLEAVGLGVHLAAGAHELLIHTESALGGISPSSSLASRDMMETAGKANQPKDAWQGIQQACESLIRGLERTASSLIGNPMKVYRHGAGAGPAVASAFRAVPAAALVPASAAAGAVHCTLLGVRNSLDPDRKRESEEKHSGPPPVL